LALIQAANLAQEEEEEKDEDVRLEQDHLTAGRRGYPFTSRQGSEGDPLDAEGLRLPKRAPKKSRYKGVAFIKGSWTASLPGNSEVSSQYLFPLPGCCGQHLITVSEFHNCGTAEVGGEGRSHRGDRLEWQMQACTCSNFKHST